MDSVDDREELEEEVHWHQIQEPFWGIQMDGVSYGEEELLL